ncbi:MAG: hypothetical protein WCE21_03155 [Candidatus Babeliales bacterium]
MKRILLGLFLCAFIPAHALEHSLNQLAQRLTTLSRSFAKKEVATTETEETKIEKKGGKETKLTADVTGGKGKKESTEKIEFSIALMTEWEKQFQQIKAQESTEKATALHALLSKIDTLIAQLETQYPDEDERLAITGYGQLEKLRQNVFFALPEIEEAQKKREQEANEKDKQESNVRGQQVGQFLESLRQNNEAVHTQLMEQYKSLFSSAASKITFDQMEQKEKKIAQLIGSEKEKYLKEQNITGENLYEAMRAFLGIPGNIYKAYFNDDNRKKAIRVSNVQRMENYSAQRDTYGTLLGQLVQERYECKLVLDLDFRKLAEELAEQIVAQLNEQINFLSDFIDVLQVALAQAMIGQTIIDVGIKAMVTDYDAKIKAASVDEKVTQGHWQQFLEAYKNAKGVGDDYFMPLYIEVQKQLARAVALTDHAKRSEKCQELIKKCVLYVAQWVPVLAVAQAQEKDATFKNTVVNPSVLLITPSAIINDWLDALSASAREAIRKIVHASIRSKVSLPTIAVPMVVEHKEDIPKTETVLPEKLSWEELKEKLQKENIYLTPIGGYNWGYFEEVAFAPSGTHAHVTLKQVYINAVKAKTGQEPSDSDTMILTATETLDNEDFKKLAGEYKIHLMPKIEDIPTIVDKLIMMLKESAEWRSLIYKFKVIPLSRIKADKGAYFKKKTGEVFPSIVIYPTSGKVHAQELLNKIFVLFAALEGVNVTPRYNAKVTSLIYIAQGDGDHKKIEKFTVFYEQPNRIYYNKQYIKPDGNAADHYLHHPQTGQPLITP